MPQLIQTRLSRLRLRASLATFLGVWSRQFLLACLLAGVLGLVLRAGAGWPARDAAWSLSLLAATPFAALWIARSRFLSRAGTAVWLDLRGGARGLLLTEIELADERWRARAERELERLSPDPRLRWHGAAARCLGGVAFALAALWVEVPAPSAPGPPRELFASVLEELREKLETLEEQVELGEETSAELARRLERLEAEIADARHPEATFEAMARLEGRLEEEAQRAEEAARAAAEALARASDSVAASDAGDAQDALREALARIEELGLDDALPSDLGQRLAATLEMPPGSRFDLTELTQLSEELRAMLEGMLGELADAGLLATGELAWLGELGELGELADYALHECDESCTQPGGT